jgi:TPR repeat protein
MVSLPNNLIPALTAAGIIYGLIAKGGEHLSRDTKENTTLWLLGEYEDTWAHQLSLLMDKIFGSKHLSWNCFLRSSAASLLFVLLLYFSFSKAGFLEVKARAGGNLSFAGVLGLGILLNLIPDYLSLLETRWLLRWFQKIRSFRLHFFILVLDLLFSGAIIWTAIALYGLVTRGRMTTPAEMLGIFSIYSIFFYSTFFTSILAWIYWLSAVIMRIFCKTFVKDLLDTEEKPFRSIALVAAGLTFMGVFLFSFSLENKDINNWWCSTFPSTCPGVYRLTTDEQKAFTYLSRICEGIDLDLCMKKANDYFLGDEDKTRFLWEKACKSGQGTGCLNLGWMHLRSGGGEEKKKLAAKFFQKSCDSNDGRGCNQLGNMYENGRGVKQDHNQAVSLFRRACEQGVSKGCNNLAWMYDKGHGVKQNFKVAVTLYQKACNLGYAKACNNLGWMYGDGRGVKKDSRKKVTFFQKACDLGDGEACDDLAWMYREGQEVKQDDKRAFDLFYQACYQGKFRACTWVGIMYQEGRGVTQDLKKAVLFYRQACDRGDGSACLGLGVMHLLGLGLKQDITKAVRFFSNACEKNTPIACYYLATYIKIIWNQIQIKIKQCVIINVPVTWERPVHVQTLDGYIIRTMGQSKRINKLSSYFKNHVIWEESGPA